MNKEKKELIFLILSFLLYISVLIVWIYINANNQFELNDPLNIVKYLSIFLDRYPKTP